MNLEKNLELNAYYLREHNNVKNFLFCMQIKPFKYFFCVLKEQFILSEMIKPVHIRQVHFLSIGTNNKCEITLTVSTITIKLFY